MNKLFASVRQEVIVLVVQLSISTLTLGVVPDDRPETEPCSDIDLRAI
jgi:hypothetical protein